MPEPKLYARRHTNRGSVLTAIDAGAVGVMTPRGPVELSGYYHSPEYAVLRSPEGEILTLTPDAANSVRVRLDGHIHRIPEVSPAHPADSSIEKIVRALDDLRVEAALQHRSDHCRTVEQRANNAQTISDLCDDIQEALVECVTG